MARAVCIRAFQFRGSVLHAGSEVDLTEDELARAFVAEHVRLLSDGERAPERTDYLGNGQPVKAPGRPDASDPSDWSAAKIAAELVRLGVPVQKGLKRDALLALHAKAVEAAAGSDLFGRPTTGGR